MKRFIVFCLLFALAAPCINARKPKKKAGEVEGQVYRDETYNFELTLPENWKYRINKVKENFRMTLTQKNYEVPPDYLDAPDYTQVPRFVVYADTSTMAPLPFLDSLLSDSYSSDQKKEMLKEFEILHDYTEGRDEVVPRSRKPITVNDNKGVLWTAQGKYVKEVSLSSSSNATDADYNKRVYGAYGGIIAAVRKDNQIVVFHLICEWAYFPTVFEEVMTIINTLKWESVEAEK